MLTTTLSFANLHNHGELFANMLRARRELFIVHNKWNLPEAMGMEYDQYDTPASRWVVVHDDAGRVLAGNRLTPTTTRCGRPRSQSSSSASIRSGSTIGSSPFLKQLLKKMSA